MSFPVSLIIPLYNETGSLPALIDTILKQSVLPQEVILVDGGSTDNTIELAQQLTGNNPIFKIVEAGRAMPGKGRNIGSEKASCSWIAYTDAGIELDRRWLEMLMQKSVEHPEADIIYGNYSPQIKNFFDKCAVISYVPPLLPGLIREKFIASALLKKKVWQEINGFPDWRAAEDLIFMENVSKKGFISTTAPEAMVYWQLRPDLDTTFSRFDLYSKYNVWAGRQAYWHYGIAKQYILMMVFLLAGVMHHWLWLLAIPLWISARVIKRIWMHRKEFGWKQLFNPLVFFQVMLITLVIDAATFSGWIKALTRKGQVRNFSTQ